MKKFFAVVAIGVITAWVAMIFVVSNKTARWITLPSFSASVTPFQQAPQPDGALETLTSPQAGEVVVVGADDSKRVEKISAPPQATSSPVPSSETKGPFVYNQRLWNTPQAQVATTPPAPKERDTSHLNYGIRQVPADGVYPLPSAPETPTEEKRILMTSPLPPPTDQWASPPHTFTTGVIAGEPLVGYYQGGCAPSPYAGYYGSGYYGYTPPPTWVPGGTYVRETYRGYPSHSGGYIRGSVTIRQGSTHPGYNRHGQAYGTYRYSEVSQFGASGWVHPGQHQFR